MLKRAKHRAKEYGREFDIDRDYLRALLEPMRCAITGMKLTWRNGNHNIDAPSIDRIDSSKGYVKGNVQIASVAYNKAKGRMTDEDVEGMLLRPWAEKRGLV